MQDRFKFRVWCKTNQEWEKDEICITNKEHYIITNPKFTRVTNIDPQYHEINFCTGLKDKNSKLIYEGDIVKDLIIPEIFYIVKWFNSGFYLESTISGSFLKFNDTQQEVIGNIYENPELLEEASNDN